MMNNYDYLYNKEYYGDLLKIKHRVEKQLSWRNYSSATVLPYMAQDIFGGGMLDEQGNYIDGSGVHREIGTGYKAVRAIQSRLLRRSHSSTVSSGRRSISKNAKAYGKSSYGAHLKVKAEGKVRY